MSGIWMQQKLLPQTDDCSTRRRRAAMSTSSSQSKLYRSTELNATERMISRIFNTGSPRNIRAGHQPNLDALFGHYEEERDKAQTKRLEKAEKATERAKEDDTTFVSSVREALGLGSKDDE